EIRIGGPHAEHEFGAAGAGRIILQIDRMAGAGSNLGLEIEISPSIHGARRRADFLGPVPEFERGSYADSGNPVTLARLQLSLKMLDARCDDPHDLFRLRIGIGLMVLEADSSYKIHQHEIGAAAADLYPEGIDRIRIEAHRHRRLADLAANRLSAQQQSLLLQ